MTQTPKRSRGQPAVVFMYAGQGAQYFHMGAELFRSEPRFRESMLRCDATAAPFLHQSIVGELYREERTKREEFTSLALSNACLVSVEYSMAQLLIDSGLRPDLHLGYSLGAFAAGVMAGVVSLEEAMWLVVEFGKLVTAVVPAGRMLAVLDSVLPLQRYPEAFLGCALSGTNCPRNFVVSAEQAVIERLRSFLESRAIRYFLLPVAYGFHSHLVAGPAWVPRVGSTGSFCAVEVDRFRGCSHRRHHER